MANEMLEIFKILNTINGKVDDLKGEMVQKFDETNARIDATNVRIDDLRSEMDQKFTETNARIDETNKRIDDLRSEVDQKIHDLKDDVDGQFLLMEENYGNKIAMMYDLAVMQNEKLKEKIDHTKELKSKLNYDELKILNHEERIEFLEEQFEGMTVV